MALLFLIHCLLFVGVVFCPCFGVQYLVTLIVLQLV